MHNPCAELNPRYVDKDNFNQKATEICSFSFIGSLYARASSVLLWILIAFPTLSKIAVFFCSLISVLSYYNVFVPNSLAASVRSCFGN